MPRRKKPSPLPAAVEAPKVTPFRLAIATQVVAVSRGPMGATAEGPAHALIGMAPSDVFEELIAVQMLAAHNASIECFTRAALQDQPVENRRYNLEAANKCSRTFAALLESMNKHRGKGQQTVRVEHVTVDARTQIAGDVHNHRGEGSLLETKDQSRATIDFVHQPSAALWCPDAEREAVPAAGHAAKRALPDARRHKPRPAKG